MKSGRAFAGAAATITLMVVAAPALAATATIEQGVNLLGMDYANAPSLSAIECRNRCLLDQRCRAYSYINPGVQGPQGRCWLKSGCPVAWRTGTPRQESWLPSLSLLPQLFLLAGAMDLRINIIPLRTVRFAGQSLQAGAVARLRLAVRLIQCLLPVHPQSGQT